MNGSFKATALGLLCITVKMESVYCQTNVHKYEFGINLGMMLYQGDLTPWRIASYETQKLTVGLHASKIINPVLSVRGQLAFGKLKADDALYNNPEYRQQRNFNFTSPVTELSAQMVWNLTASNYKDKGFSPYVFAGAGFSRLKVRSDWSALNTEYFVHSGSEIMAGLAADSAHGAPRLIPVLPVGGGIRYFFGRNWGLNAEATYRLINTDYLDGFSQSANPDKKDKYMGYTIGIIYRAGKKDLLKCPKLKY